MGIVLLCAFIGTLAVATFFVGVYSVVERGDEVSGRLAAYAASTREQVGGSIRRAGGLSALFGRLDRLVSSRNIAQRLALQLAQANIRTTVAEFAVVEISMSVVGAMVGFVVGGYTISGIAGALGGLLLPVLWVQRRRARRVKAFHDQLTDVLSLTVGSLRGGHALPTALDLVSKELGPPASEEFTRVLREIGFGLSQAEALNNLVKRMENDDLQLVVTAVNISHEVGGNLSLVLEKIAETIRERIRLQGEIRVLTTQQRLTSYLLVALPFALGLILALINPKWMMQMFAPGWVRIIPATATVMVFIGFLITRRLIRIEV